MMQVENLGKLERRMSVTVARADIDQEVQVRLKKLSRTLKMPGFRPGKVPLKIVAQQHGFEIQNEVLNQKVGEAFHSAAEKNQLRVAGSLRVQPKTDSNVSDDTLVFDATFEVYPEVKINDLSALQIEKVATQVSDAEVDKTIAILRKQRVHYHAKNDHGEHGHTPPEGTSAGAQNGDRVTIDFVGKIGDVAFTGGSATDFTFVLGEGRMLPEFEAAVVGLEVGASKTFPLSFAPDYHGKEVAGKTAEFNVTLKKVEWAHQPEIDSDFARSLGIVDGSIEKMRADILRNIQREVEQRIQTLTKNNVIDGLLKVVELDVPKALIDSEIAQLKVLAQQDIRRRGMKVGDMSLPDDIFKSQAERRVRIGLVIAEIIRAQGLQAKPEQIKAQIEKLSETYENPQEVVRWYYSDQKRLREIEALVLEENVVAYVLEQAQVTEKTIPFDELMNTAA